MSIKDILKKSEKLYYIMYCLSKINSAQFRNRVLTIRTNPYCILFEHYGNENIDKVFYDILVGDETKGFCSAVRDTLYFMLYADALGFVPYVRFTDNIPYHEDHTVNGANNVFEYYFKQPARISYEELMQSCKVAKAENLHRDGVFPLLGIQKPISYYSDNSEVIDMCAEMYRKYFVLNDLVQEQLNKDMESIVKPGLIGVHYRGTDFKVGYNGHPVAVQYERHIQETEKLLNTGNYSGVFLATEDGDVVDIFKEKFGNILYMYNDVIRGTGETNAYNMKSQRINHHYLLGYEVMRDYYTLAACDVFITSMSGVGITTQIVKKPEELV